MSTRPESRPRPTGDRAMQRATVLALVAGVVLDGVLLLVAVMAFDTPAVLGVLAGTGLTLVIVVPTVVISFLGPRMTPVSMASVVLGSWAVKMLIVIVVLLVLSDVEAISRPWLGLALLLGALSAVLLEVVLLARSRQPLDVPLPRAEDEQDPP